MVRISSATLIDPESLERAAQVLREIRDLQTKLSQKKSEYDGILSPPDVRNGGRRRFDYAARAAICIEQLKAKGGIGPTEVVRNLAESGAVSVPDKTAMTAEVNFTWRVLTKHPSFFRRDRTSPRTFRLVNPAAAESFLRRISRNPTNAQVRLRKIRKTAGQAKPEAKA